MLYHFSLLIDVTVCKSNPLFAILQEKYGKNVVFVTNSYYLCTRKKIERKDMDKKRPSESQRLERPK